MKVGDLIRWSARESTGGMVVPEEIVGIIVQHVDQETLPNLFEIMTISGEFIIEYSDELAAVKIEESK